MRSYSMRNAQDASHAIVARFQKLRAQARSGGVPNRGPLCRKLAHRSSSFSPRALRSEPVRFNGLYESHSIHARFVYLLV